MELFGLDDPLDKLPSKNFEYAINVEWHRQSTRTIGLTLSLRERNGGIELLLKCDCTDCELNQLALVSLFHQQYVACT